MTFNASELVDRYARAMPPEGKPEYLRLHRRRYIALLQALAPVPTGSRVLEIGCNPGQFTEILVQAGFRVSGLDLHPEHREELWRRLGVEVSRANLETDGIPYPDRSFDAVTAVGPTYVAALAATVAAAVIPQMASKLAALKNRLLVM